MGSKLFRILGFGGLAVFMGCMAVFGCALPQIVRAESVNGNVFAGGDSASAGQRNARSALGLDPENDPVVFTTESGLEIKHSGGVLDIKDGLGSEALKGYPYFTMGTYNGHAVNWVIIGKSTDMSGCHLREVDSTPAGQAIENDARFELEEYVGMINPDEWNVAVDSDISANCVYVISECVLLNTQFRTSSAAANYVGSNLQSVILGLYNSGLGLTTAQKAFFMPTRLQTTYWTTVASSPTKSNSKNPISENQYLFAMGGTYDWEQFADVFTGLSTNAMRVAYTIGTSTAAGWWKSVGHPSDISGTSVNYAFNIEPSGNASNCSKIVTTSYGVRPCGIVTLV